MKKTFCYLLVSVSSLFLSACLFGQGGGSDNLIIAKSAIDLDEKKKRDRRGEVARGSCEDEDNESDCEDICEEVYNEEGNREDEGKEELCMELSYKTVLSFEDILDVIGEPYYSDLRNIEAKHFSAFLEVSVTPWVEKTKRLNNNEAENLLKWIASESNVASAIKKAYENTYEDFDLYEGVERLFQEIAPNLESRYTDTTAQGRVVRRCAELCSAVSNKELSQNQSFWSIADSSNMSGMEIACAILRQNCRYDGYSVKNSVEITDCPAKVKAPLREDGCGL
ncbi:MAG: hypothetical protein OXN83_02835 [Oligoflexia bacterium]|nr:hypothetical protein [Oligoflexia bacterium]